jgi:hypothetical protein
MIMVRFLVLRGFWGVLQGTIRLLCTSRHPAHEKYRPRYCIRTSGVDGLTGTVRKNLSGALAFQGIAGLSDLNQRIRRS